MSNELPLGGSRLVPEGWTLYSIDEIKADEKYSCVAGPFGSSISSKYFTETGVPIIRGNNLKNNLTKFVAQDFAFVSEERAKKYLPQHVKAGDLVFTCWGTIGQVGLIPQDGPYPEYIISNKQLKLRVNPDLANNLFVFYYLSSKEGVEHIRSRAIGSAVPGINLGILKSIKIALPSLSTQQSITDILSNYDRLIDDNNRRIALLEESIHLLYKEWFVRLRFPGYESVKIVDGIPEGWKIKSLKDIATLNYGKSLTKQDRKNGSIPVYGSSGIIGYHDKALIKEPGIIVGRKGNIGTVYWCPTSFYPIDTVYYINNSEASFFLYHTLSNLSFISTDAAVPGLNRNYAYSLPVLIPTNNLRESFEALAIPIYKQLYCLQVCNNRLTTARDLLLPRLMNGSIAV